MKGAEKPIGDDMVDGDIGFTGVREKGGKALREGVLP